jgi:hypothetical protein
LVKAGRSSIAAACSSRHATARAGYQLRTHGGRVPIQWLVAPTAGNGIHQPLGSFDLVGSIGRLTPTSDAFADRHLHRRSR